VQNTSLGGNSFVYMFENIFWHRKIENTKRFRRQLITNLPRGYWLGV